MGLFGSRTACGCSRRLYSPERAPRRLACFLDPAARATTQAVALSGGARPLEGRLPITLTRPEPGSDVIPRFKSSLFAGRVLTSSFLVVAAVRTHLRGALCAKMARGTQRMSIVPPERGGQLDQVRRRPGRAALLRLNGAARTAATPHGATGSASVTSVRVHRGTVRIKRIVSPVFGLSAGSLVRNLPRCPKKDGILPRPVRTPPPHIDCHL